MDKTNIVAVIAMTTMAISVLLSLFLIQLKAKYRLSNRLFATFLLLITIDISAMVFDFSDQGISNSEMFRNLMAFLQLPVFYLYVVSVCYKDFKLRAKHLLHGIPFVLANLILVPRFYTADLPSKIGFLARNSSMPEVQFNHAVLLVQIVAYFAAAFILVGKARKLYLENYSGASMTSFQWLFQFTLSLSIFYGLVFLKNVFKFTDYPEVSEGLKISLFILELCIICWYLLKALNNPLLFRNLNAKLKLVKNYVSEENQNNSLTSNQQEFDPNIEKLKQYMVENRPFLNSDLTIQDVAADLNIPLRELSLLINHRLGQHFFDFINAYRIEMAMNMLRDPSKSKVTVLEILYEVGFNSKSSFNTAFKKHTGMTPTEYRKTAVP